MTKKLTKKLTKKPMKKLTKKNPDKMLLRSHGAKRPQIFDEKTPDKKPAKKTLWTEPPNVKCLLFQPTICKIASILTCSACLLGGGKWIESPKLGHDASFSTKNSLLNRITESASPGSNISNSCFVTFVIRPVQLMKTSKGYRLLEQQDKWT